MIAVRGAAARSSWITRVAVAVLALLAWLIAARTLWHTVVPASLRLPSLDPHSFFSAASLSRADAFETFADVDQLLAEVALLITLAVYARNGARFTRESAAGPAGTGMLLGMIGFAFVWIAQLPFGAAMLWWERSHHISHLGYAAWLVSSFLALGGKFLFVSVALAIVMGLSRLVGFWWWLPGAVAFVALYALFAFVSPFLTPDLHPVTDPGIARDGRALAAKEGVAGTRVVVQRIHTQTTAPNAESMGIGPTRRVVLWDTVLDGRFDRPELDAILAHELGHIAHDDIARSIGWFALFAFPAAFVIALVARRRGGLARPEAVPLALFALVVLQLAFMPLDNARSRRVEAAADWASLTTTRDPAAERRLFVGLTTASLARPNPASWAYVLFANHPSTMQRIAMAEAWRKTHRGG